ncbi:hypothetical protein PMAYCL1PPCAC_21752, partial [Pristionchus mayeri]
LDGEVPLQETRDLQMTFDRTEDNLERMENEFNGYSIKRITFHEQFADLIHSLASSEEFAVKLIFLQYSEQAS